MALVKIKGVPLDMGAGRRGVDMGVSAIRLAGLSDTLAALGHKVEDHGNVLVPVVETLKREPSLFYIDTIADACRQVYKWFSDLSPDTFAITLGGDHSISMGSIAGTAQHGRTGVIWVDAHTDIHTPKSSRSGNIHGMPLAHLLGMGDPRLLAIWDDEGPILRPEDVVYIGLRSVDTPERNLIKKLGILTFTMKEVDIQGIAKIAEQTLFHLKGLTRIHVSFDADVLDPTIAPGVGTPVPGGLSYREAHLLLELLCDANVVNSLDLVEVNPILDVRNRTAQTIVDLTTSLLGSAIL